MSVIENALALKPRAEGAPAAETRARRAPRSRPVGAPTQATRQFQTVTLDPVALERNCVLPQFADRAALRAYKILRTRLLSVLQPSIGARLP